MKSKIPKVPQVKTKITQVYWQSDKVPKCYSALVPHEEGWGWMTILELAIAAVEKKYGIDVHALFGDEIPAMFDATAETGFAWEGP